jgi:hypothetical protein
MLAKNRKTRTGAPARKRKPHRGPAGTNRYRESVPYRASEIVSPKDLVAQYEAADARRMAE